MEYIYGALALHAAGKEVSEENMKKMMGAVGVEVDETKVKSLIVSLKNVNIDEVLKSAPAVAAVPVAAPVAAPAQEEKEEKEEEKEEKKEASEEEIASGLGALFG